MQGEELKQHRKAMNLSQGELAALLGLSATFIGLMERGANPIERRTELAVLYLVEHPEMRVTAEIEKPAWRTPGIADVGPPDD